METATDLVCHIFVRKSARRCLAEKDRPPFSTFRELETLVMDLMRQLTRWGEYESADTGSQVRFRPGDGRA